MNILRVTDIGQIEAALRAGDLAALRAAVDDPSVIPDGPMPAEIGSCLEYAVGHSPIAFVRALLELGADPNHRGADDRTPLHVAVASGNVPAVRLLLVHGADPWARARIDNCETPIEMAERNGLIVIADLLKAPAR